MTIDLPVDEGFAMDMLAVCEIKMNKNHSQANINNFFMFFENIQKQIGKYDLYKIVASLEYKKLYQVNEKLFNVIEKIRSKEKYFEASFVDYLNFCRWFHKNKLQKTFYKNETKEVKIGYEGWHFIECDKNFTFMFAR